jgi:hypothetical protein
MERELYHNVSARLDENELKMAKYLQEHYTNTSIARKISLADVLRTAIKNEYLRLMEEQEPVQQSKPVTNSKEVFLEELNAVQQQTTTQETASTKETNTETNKPKNSKQNNKKK